METADVVVIGAGIIGTSVAYHLLARAPDLKVVVLEQEEAPGTGATARATGGIRFQFSTPANIQLSLLSRPEWQHFADQFGTDIGLVHHGYLFVTGTTETVAAFHTRVALQTALGVPTQWLTPPEIAARVPPMATADLLAGTFCPWDGSADPYAALTGYLQRARDLGAQLRTSCPVTAVLQSGGRVTGVRTPQGELAAPVVVNAAGPYAGEVGHLAGVAVPVQPYKRSVLQVAAPLELHGPMPHGLMPLCVDMDSGWYVHRQPGGQLLLGGTDKVLAPGFDTRVTWDDEQRLLGAGLQRFPCLERAAVLRSYAGLREITPDFHALLGPVPDLAGFFLACGFSGHGFMHAPAAGRLTAEFIFDGTARSMDAAPLLLERFQYGCAPEEQAAF